MWPNTEFILTSCPDWWQPYYNLRCQSLHFLDFLLHLKKSVLQLLSHKCDSAGNWREIIKSNPQRTNKIVFQGSKILIYEWRVDCQSVTCHCKCWADCAPWRHHPSFGASGLWSDKPAVQLSPRHFLTLLLPWSLHPARGDSSKSWSSGLFRFFDICCSLLEWWIYPPLSRNVLITRDTFSRRGTQRIQQSAGGERRRNTNKSQSRSFRSLLWLSSSRRAMCAKLPCAGQPSIWRRGEAWSRSPPDSHRSRAICRCLSSADAPGLTPPDRWEIFAAEVICRSRAWRIMLGRCSDGNYALEATCWSSS